MDEAYKEVADGGRGFNVTERSLWQPEEKAALEEQNEHEEKKNR